MDGALRRVVGYLVADASVHDAGVAGVSRLSVRPERCGEGFGSRLLDALEARLDGERLRLGVTASNDRAVGFYRARGFQQVDAVHDDALDVRAPIVEKRL